MTLRITMITPDKRGIGRRIKEAVQAAGGRVLSLGAVREMRGMNETGARLTAPSDAVLREVIASIGRIPGIAILDVRPEGAPSDPDRSIQAAPGAHSSSPPSGKP